MGRSFVIGMLALALVVPGQATARLTLATPAGRVDPPPWQGWVDAAQSHVWTPDVTVTFTHGICPDWGLEAWGCAGPSEVWVRVSLRDRVWARWALDHELGHVVDFGQGDVRRMRLANLRGWRRWRPEQFADDWAHCANPHAFRARVMRRLRPFCRALRAPPGPLQDPLREPFVIG